ncbi:MAG: thymidylate synthase [Candidatus Nomurabacteria bacterium]|jgi:thymidylate synthase|nr:thymidylate synthase [Candidatus Nomurabacteria bacterium]
MSKFDEQYLDLCQDILDNGEYAQNRTGVATYRLPHKILTFDLGEGFPILTTKFVAFKSAVIEMLWIYQAQSNDVRWLQERGVSIWNEWQIGEDGKYMGKDFGKEYAYTIGTAYGWIVRKYELIQNLIKTIKEDPTNRRMIISLWQNEWLPTAALPSCVWNSQWNVSADGKLNMMVTVRSNDVPLGMPFNVSQYAVLCHLIAQVCGLRVGQFTYVINDAHIYENQIEGIREQIRRRDEKIATDGKLFDAPRLWINPSVKDFFDFDNSKELKDIRLENYEHQGKIKMPVAV